MDEIQKRLLLEVADLHGVPEGAYNIRSNSRSVGRQSSAHIEIVSKTDVSGIDIRIAPGTRNESVHIPVVLTESGLKEVVYGLSFYTLNNSYNADRMGTLEDTLHNPFATSSIWSTT